MKKYTNIGDNLKILRKDLSQAEFAAKLNIPFRTYQRYEAGERRPLDAVLHHVAMVCRVSVDWILTGVEIGADRVSQPEEPYYDAETKMILDMLGGMTKEQKREALRFIKGQKCLAESEKKLKEG